MKHIRISIAINCYNHAAFIGDAIESALRQTHTPLEVIVVDDGSTDGSRELILSYGDRVKAILQPNGGQGSAYNAGFAAATGEVVVFLDSDDWLYPDAAHVIAQSWQPGVSKVQFGLDMVNAAGQRLGRSLPRSMHDATAFELLSRFGTYGSPPGSGNAYAADFLHKVLPLDVRTWRIAADSVPILLAPAHGRIVSLPRPQGAYRLHAAPNPQALTFNNAPDKLWSEYTRIERSQALVQGHLKALGRPCADPLLYPPWEARMLAMCLRFGGEPGAARPATAEARAQRAALWRRLLLSLWRWPDSRLPMRVAQSAWVLALWILPRALAHRVGRLDRELKGAADAA